MFQCLVRRGEQWFVNGEQLSANMRVTMFFPSGATVTGTIIAAEIRAVIGSDMWGNSYGMVETVKFLADGLPVELAAELSTDYMIAK